jgi:aryl-phospho-beta-D-glucosidase BglC (GH1 family)
MGADKAAKMEEHYKTFITEKDFAEIAAAGLNWIR